jgi:hypothetical protein
MNKQAIVEDHKKLTVSPRSSNGLLAISKRYIGGRRKNIGLKGIKRLHSEPIGTNEDRKEIQ